jgi:hypothetical protein
MTLDNQASSFPMSLDQALFIDRPQEGSYLTLPFNMPAETASMTLRYEYERHRLQAVEVAGGTFTSQEEINIIDLGLIAPDGRQVGASGSDKLEITIGETWATPGYQACALLPGRWEILVGAYKVAPEGVRVTYHHEFTPKAMRLLKGDLHTHTLASDGVLTLDELGRHALRHGLDFLAITDHNQMISAEALPHIQGLTMIPGVEWSHYQGHTNFLGVDRPYDGPYFTHNLETTRAIFDTARERGALITLNHPFEESCPYQFDLDQLPFDVLEVWNGPMRESNIRALGLWQQLLASGQKVPVCGGSDYHRDRLFQILGGPTTCVYAPSTSPADILSAVRQGHCFITFSPEGPTLDFRAGDALMGDTLVWEGGREVTIDVEGLAKGDVLRMVTQDDIHDLYQAPTLGSYQAIYPITNPGFYRIEVWRTFLPGIPPLPALLSNPIYFDEG